MTQKRTTQSVTLPPNPLGPDIGVAVRGSKAASLGHRVHQRQAARGRGCRDNNQSQRAKAGRLFTLRPPALEPRSRGCGHPERDLELSGSSACKRRQPCKPHSPHAGGRSDFARHGAITHAITGQFLVKECRGEYVARQALTWARMAASFQGRKGSLVRPVAHHYPSIEVIS